MDISQFVSPGDGVVQFLNASRCVSCAKIPIHPVRCEDITSRSASPKDGHLFCGTCASKLPLGTKCPGGSHIVSRFRNEPTVQTLMDAQKVRCKWYAKDGRGGRRKLRIATGRVRGCEWIGCLKDLESHLKSNCLYEKVKCERCGALADRGCYELHRLQCSTPDVVCEFCGKNFKGTAVSAHRGSCEEMWVDCPHGCLTDTGGRSRKVPPLVTRLKRKDLKNHEQICEEALISCVYSKVGCEVRFRRKLKKRHEMEYMSKHMELMLDDVGKRLAPPDESKQEQKPKKRMRTSPRPDSSNQMINGHRENDIGNYHYPCTNQKEVDWLVKKVKSHETGYKRMMKSTSALQKNQLKNTVQYDEISKSSTNILIRLNAAEKEISALSESVKEMKQLWLKKSLETPSIHPAKDFDQLGDPVYGHYKWTALYVGGTVQSAPVQQSGLSFVFTTTRKPNGKSTSFHIRVGGANTSDTSKNALFKAKVLVKVTASSYDDTILCTRVFQSPQIFHGQRNAKIPNREGTARTCWGWGEFLNSSMAFDAAKPINFQVTLVTSSSLGSSELDDVEQILKIKPRV